MKKSLSLDECEILFAAWKEQHGVLANSKKYGTPYMSVPKNPELRREMLIKLIDYMMADPYGYEESDFGVLMKGRIIDACVFVDYEDKKQLDKWRGHVKDDLNRALATIFRKDFPDITRNKGEQDIEPVQYKDPVEEAKLTNPIDMAKIGPYSEPVDIPNEEFLKSLEVTDE